MLFFGAINPTDVPSMQNKHLIYPPIVALALVTFCMGETASYLLISRVEMKRLDPFLD